MYARKAYSSCKFSLLPFSLFFFCHCTFFFFFYFFVSLRTHPYEATLCSLHKTPYYVVYSTYAIHFSFLRRFKFFCNSSTSVVSPLPHLKHDKKYNLCLSLSPLPDFLLSLFDRDPFLPCKTLCKDFKVVLQSRQDPASSSRYCWTRNLATK